MLGMSPAKDINSRSIFQELARAFDHGSTQNFIFGPVGLQVILQHFLEGFFEIVIFSALSSSFLSTTSKKNEKHEKTTFYMKKMMKKWFFNFSSMFSDPWALGSVVGGQNHRKT